MQSVIIERPDRGMTVEARKALSLDISTGFLIVLFSSASP